MPRISNETSALLDDLMSRIDRLADAARQEGREQALSEIRALVGGGVAAGRGPVRPPRSATSTGGTKTDGRTNSWSGMTPAARLARVNAIRKGKGLPPKDKL